MKEFLFVVVLVAQVAAPGLAQKGTIAGQLRDRNGTPLAGVRVAAVTAPEAVIAPGQVNVVAAAESDPSGNYRIENLPPGRYYVAAGPADFPSYYPGVIPLAGAAVVVVSAGSTINAIDFSPLLPAGVKVAGHVIQPLDQRPALGSLRVMMYGASGAGAPSSAIVTADGAFEVENVPPGAHTFLINPSGIGTISVAITVSDKDINGIELLVPRTVPITGRITVEDGGPLPRLFLTLSGSAGVFNINNLALRQDGTFSATLPEGEHHMTLAGLPAGYYIQSMTYGQANVLKQTLQISASNPNPFLIRLGVASPPPWVRVSGHVLGSATQVTASGGNLSAEIQTVVNPDGTFQFSKVLPGMYTLRTVPNVGGASFVTVSVTNHDVTGIELIVPKTVAIKGRIAVENGAPMPRVNLVFMGPLGRLAPQIAPAADGTFILTLPEGEHRLDVNGFPGSYRLKSITYGVSDPMKEPMKISASVPAELVLTFELAPSSSAAKVSGRIIGYGQQPLDGKRVVLEGQGLVKKLEASIGPGGSFEFDNVPSGKYFAHFEPTVIGATYANVTVVDKDINDVELMIPKLVTVRGQVVVEGGAPRPSFPIRFTGPPGTFGIDAPGMDAQGNFVATIPYGDYRIVFNAVIGVCCGPEGLPPGYTVKSVVYDSVALPDDRIKVLSSDAGKLIITLAASTVKVSGRVAGIENLRTPATVFLRGDRYSGLPTFSAAAAADGSFEFPRVTPGTYWVRVNPDVPGFTPKIIGVADKDVTGVELTVPRGINVNGRIVLEDGVPLPRFAFALDAGAERSFLFARIQPDGTFTAQIPEGEHQISIEELAPSYQVKSFTYGTTDLQKNPLNADPSPSNRQIVLTLGPAGHWSSVAGRVIGAGALPAEWRHVLLYDSVLASSFDVEPAADGSFQIPRVPPGSYTARVNSPSNLAISTSANVTVVAENVTGVELRVSPVTTIPGRAVLDGGGPLPTFSLELTGGVTPTTVPVFLQPNGTFTVMAPQGEYRAQIKDLRPGYVLKQIRSGAADLTKEAWTISSASSDELVVTFGVTSPPPWVRVSGKVVGNIPKAPQPDSPARNNPGQQADPSVVFGNPTFTAGPESVILILSELGPREQPSIFRATIQPDGSFEFPQVVRGTYLVRLGPVPAPIQPNTLTLKTSDLTGIELVISQAGRQ